MVILGIQRLQKLQPVSLYAKTFAQNAPYTWLRHLQFPARAICWLLRAPDKRFSHTLDSLGRWPRPASSFRSAQAATLLEFHVYCMRECKDFKLVILLVLVYSWPACISFELTRFVLLRWQFSGLLHLARSWFCSYVSQKPAAYVCMVTDFGYWKVAILLGLIAHKGIKLFKFV